MFFCISVLSLLNVKPYYYYYYIIVDVIVISKLIIIIIIIIIIWLNVKRDTTEIQKKTHVNTSCFQIDV